MLAGAANAQFTGNIEGVVTDPSGGTIAGGKITLTNVATSVSASTTSDGSGYYRFLSLAPGDYKIRVEASGFSTAESNVHLEYNQTLNVPMEVKVGTATEAITVTAQTPLVNTSETRNQQTLQTQELNTLPLAGRSMISLVTLAPGVSGLGTQTSNAPGSGVDNYSTETAVDVSANGQGTVSNMWIVDGLDATSAIRQGVVNLTPNPDVVQEATTEVNTFNVEYGRASSIQFAMTTKSGADQFHGLASDYFNYQ